MFQYIACGLSNVWLANGYIHEGTGDLKLSQINDLPALHRLIGTLLINRRGCLVSAEMRFLRQEMNLSRRSLGDKLGVEPAFINQWERHNARLPRIADVLLRVLYAGIRLKDCETELSIHLLSDEENEPCAERMIFRWDATGWQRDSTHRPG